MAAKARIEWVRLGYGPNMDGAAANVIRSFHGALEIVPGVTATPAVSRPLAPDFGPAKQGYALIRGLEGKFVVTWGVDPTAALLTGKMIASGEEVPIFVNSGDRLSFIEVV